MAGKRRLFGIRIAQALLIALLATQGVLLVNACSLPASGPSMAYADADMPGPCTGLGKNACLMAYLQADQAPGSDGVAIAGFDGVAVPASLPIAGIPDHPGTTKRLLTPPSAAPPLHILFCRMLR